MTTTNLFNEPAGFRLARLELYNWGTFDGQIWMMQPDTHTAVLTGANGSGKSTVVDALLTLLVEGRTRNYNLASGAGSSRERSERTYIRGQYSRSRGDNALDARANTLRGSDSYTVLLAVFSDAAGQQTVTLAQVLHISSNDNVNKRYYVASCELNIETHFSERLITANDLPDGAEYFTTFSAYISAARKALGLGGRPKALDLFNQTVAVKDIASLNQFVRDHMLDKGDPEARVDALQAQYRELNDAHAAIQRAGHQLKILTPLVEAAGDYRNYEERIKRYETAKSLVSFYVAERAESLLTAAIQEKQTQRSSQASRLTTVDDELTDLRRELQDVEIAIAQDSVGQMKRELEGKIPPLQREIDALKRAANNYDKQVTRLDFAPYHDEEAFYSNRERAKTRQADTETRINELQSERDTAQAERYESQQQARALTSEINYLRENLSNIPERVARIREQISKALNISVDAMPFIGELLKVRDDASEWEGALERLLHSFAQELIIPQAHYQQISQYVDSHNLNGRLVYRPVDATRRTDSPPAQQQNGHMMAFDHIQIHPDTPYQDWLAARLMQRFDYVCCETPGALRQSKRGITRQGQVKHSASRHEKDDRRDLHNRRNYVLGWDNRAKLRQLETEYDDLIRQLARLNDRIQTIETDLTRYRDDMRALSNLLDVQDFTEIDWRSRQTGLDRLQRQLKELEQQAKQLQKLEAQRDDLRQQIEQADKRRDSIKSRLTTLDNQIEGYQQRLKTARKTLAQATDNDERLWQEVGDVIEEVDKDNLTIDSLATRADEIEISLQRSVSSFRGYQTGHRATILDAMNTFRRDYPDDGASLTADIDALPAYERIQRQLETDDLPKYEERFKEMLDRTVTRGVMAFSSNLTEQERTIDRSIADLNESLARVDYGNGSYIRLLAEQTRDAEINDFKKTLRACIPDAGDSSQEELERAYNRIKDLIERFDSDLNWMRRVIDVRRWRVFAAEQIAPDGTQIDYYSDSSGKSGGQKAKLAYTILGSAIAHQYGLQDTHMTSKSFRFVVIDEAFSKLDDDNARFAMQLFEQLGLQLLVVTPMQQLHLIEDYVHAYHVVYNTEAGNDSRLYNLSRAQYRDRRREFQAQDQQA